MQTFTDRSGGLYLMVVNQDLSATRTATLEFGAESPRYQRVTDVATRRPVMTGRHVRVRLAPGTGKLLRVEPAR